MSNLEPDAIFFSVGRKESERISKSPAGAFPTWPLQNPSQNLAFYELEGNGIQTRALFKWRMALSKSRASSTMVYVLDIRDVVATDPW